MYSASHGHQDYLYDTSPLHHGHHSAAFSVQSDPGRPSTSSEGGLQSANLSSSSEEDSGHEEDMPGTSEDDGASFEDDSASSEDGSILSDEGPPVHGYATQPQMHDHVYKFSNYSGRIEESALMVSPIVTCSSSCGTLRTEC